MVVNILVGIVGAVLGGWLFRRIGLEATGIIGSLFTATTGAVLLIVLATFVVKR
jgi:uncharacterized membrane protein YeaQ/YmgE (transglycosylase-associated protein family)